MSFETFNIYFSGNVIEGQDRDEVKRRVGKIFGANEAQLERMFSNQPIVVKKNVDMDTAITYRVMFRDAGALVDIKRAEPDAGVSPPRADLEQGLHQTRATKQQDAAANTDEITLAPARTGSLEDCAPTPTVAQLPDISGINLAPPGEPMPAAPDAPPADIDIGNIELFPPRTGSLEDCHQDPPAQPIPDISGIKLVDPD